MTSSSNAHQVVTGALNKGESCFAVGNVEGINFTACAVGCDVVILAADFERVQVIPSSSSSAVQVSCVDSCADSGKIAASYGNVVRIFEPQALAQHTSKHKLDYRWFETDHIDAPSAVTHLSWNIEGMRLLVTTERQLLLYEHRLFNTVHSGRLAAQEPVEAVSFGLGHEEDDAPKPRPSNVRNWQMVWSTELSSKVKYIRYSPDGMLFATAGTNDRLVRVWYEDLKENDTDAVSFSFTYLYHPRAVQGFEWRKTGRYMPRHCLPNVLITWCADNISRIWCETLSAAEVCDVISGDGGDSQLKVENNRRRLHHRHYRIRHVRHAITRRLKHLTLVYSLGAVRPIQLAGCSTSKRERTTSFSSKSSSMQQPQQDEQQTGDMNLLPAIHQQHTLRFHLAVTINAETDCFLVPSIESSATANSFAVHWLNNKELVYSLGAEKLLAESLMEHYAEGQLTKNAATPSDTTSHHSMGERKDSVASVNNMADSISFASTSQALNEFSDAKDLLDIKLEGLLRQWHHSSDILFTIHPIDGSLLIWTLEGLDEVFKQPTLSFSFRFPSAFPLTDAVSLCHSLATFNPHHPVFVDIMQKHNTSAVHAQQQCNVVFLLTNHENGSLNLWQLSVDEKSNFSSVLNIAHKSRMCGHRFRIDRVVCHPVLPLLLTTSHHRVCRNQSADTRAGNGDSFESELIMWMVSPVGPLCHSGGVRELARINSAETNAFVDLAWVPAILPSSTLGSVCNSPSSCFVASDGTALRLYQAVIDARALLAEISSVNVQRNSRRFSVVKILRTVAGRAGSNNQSASVSNRSTVGSVGSDSPQGATRAHLVESFNVISSQSTARPGCILQLDSLAEGVQDWGNMSFLHVYQSQTLLTQSRSPSTTNQPAASPRPAFQRLDSVVDHSTSSAFHEVFFVVTLEKRVNAPALLHMWKLVIASQSPAAINARPYDSRNSSPEPDIYAAGSNANSATAARLYVQSTKVFCSSLAVPPGISITSAAASAGHLPSSSLYPACSAPYLMVTACTDDVIRFWRCEQRSGDEYLWLEWHMISERGTSGVELEGCILAVSSACSSRWAAAYTPITSINSHSTAVQVAVYECESTGGIDWVQEDTLDIKHAAPDHGHDLDARMNDFDFQHDTHSPVNDMIMQLQISGKGGSMMKRIASIPRLGANMRRVVSDHALRSPSFEKPSVVHLDWISTEDGGHILTVGVGSHIYLYTQVTEDVAQQNVAKLKEVDTRSASEKRQASLRRQASSMVPHRIKPTRWVCVRCIALKSVDGLPPTPIMLSWVRDGVLVLGMESEMRVYNQWSIGLPDTQHTQLQPTLADSLKPPVGRPQPLSPHANLTLPHTSEHRGRLSLHVSPSMSMLDASSGKRQSKQQAPVPPTIPSQSTLQSSASLAKQHVDARGETVVDIVSDEGLFEASRWASPMLPQYHPKQLMELMNAGKTRRVKAILLHVLHCLRSHSGVATSGNALSRGDSMRRGNTGDDGGDTGMQSRRKSIAGGTLLADEVQLDYEQIESIRPLPLYQLLAADDDTGAKDTANAANDKGYDELFNGVAGEAGDDLDLDDDESDGSDGDNDDDDEDEKPKKRRRSRTSSRSSHASESSIVNTTFTARHTRMLTRYLTHLQLPGLSSVDQMHLLALADTLSHFSADVIDKLAVANAALKRQAVAEGAAVASVASGYATAGTGIESVDECALRFLMAMKQHEYLLKCLPLKQRAALAKEGLSTSHIIWALHSETEAELLSCIPCMQKGSPSWAELKALGMAWWVNNQNTLKQCIEKLAKAAFQAKNEPLDAAIFYLAMRKKNVLTHLYKSVNNAQMADFFSQNFTDPKWKKAALKNAFVLMSKQRFAHAAAFFLLGDSLKDAIQTCLVNLQDIQMALVIIRLYETDAERQRALMRELLAKHVLGVHVEDLGEPLGSEDEEQLAPGASKDPFLRSMTYWLLKDYARAASTLLCQVAEQQPGVSLSHVFYFYSYLRTHPLVVRQRLDHEGVKVQGTDKFLRVAKLMEQRIAPSERRLFFMTAAAHMKAGCAMLGLDVLSRLPKSLCLSLPKSPTGQQTATPTATSPPVTISIDAPTPAKPQQPEQSADALDWSAPLTNGVSKRPDMGELALTWSDDEGSSGSDDGIVINKKAAEPEPPKELPVVEEPSDADKAAADASAPPDVLAQHMKFVCCLRLFMEELATLASGAQVESGTLRSQLYFWLEKQVEVLVRLCDYNASAALATTSAAALSETASDMPNTGALHEQIRADRHDLNSRVQSSEHRRRWLWCNQQLLRTLAAYCGLHGSQNVGLASARMELLLLLLELQQDNVLLNSSRLNAPLPVQTSFPLLSASVASYRTSISDPIRYLQNQASDLLIDISNLTQPPLMTQALSKTYLYYGLSQCLSACVYESLSELNETGRLSLSHLGRRRQSMAAGAVENEVSTLPSKWPGVENLVTIMMRERDEHSPNLLVLLAECFVAVYVSLFAYAFTAYDSRWLFRLASHQLDARSFALMFGGGAVGGHGPAAATHSHHHVQQPLPPRPPPPSADRQNSRDSSPFSASRITAAVDPASLRAKFHAKLFSPSTGPAAQGSRSHAGSVSDMGAQQQPPPPMTQQMKWVPPKRSVLSFLTSKPAIDCSQQLGIDYDSDATLSDAESDLDDDSYDDPLANPAADFMKKHSEEQPVKEHLDPNSYAWRILRLVLVRQVLHKLTQFLSLCGLPDHELAQQSGLLHSAMSTLESWRRQLETELDLYPGGCPVGLLPHTHVDNTSGPSLHKYRTILEPNNTPFDPMDNSSLPVRRLWAYLVRQEHLMDSFIRHIFGRQQTSTAAVQSMAAANASDGDQSAAAAGQLPEPFKITHRENDPITAFAVCSSKPGWLVLSTGRELQEMDISAILCPKLSWMHDAAELDIQLSRQQRDALRDNDDYVLFDNADRKDLAANFVLTPFILDRSRKALRKLCKRQVNGIRRIAAHPSLPYYVSGAQDGSVRLWEWGVAQPLYTPRQAGQYAKVSCAQFSNNGGKFGITDGDGCLCLWQSGTGSNTLKRPYFNQKCHSKSAAEFNFLGDSSSLIATAGYGSGDHNLALWDTLLPPNKSIIQSWSCHPEGASCCLYLTQHQTLLSGGRNGQMCLWDLRNRQLRHTIKAFDNATVKSLTTDPSGELIVAGSADGDLKIWSASSQPQLLYSLPGEHMNKSGFSLRQVGNSSVQGVQHLLVDAQRRMYSCGGDCSIKLRALPSLLHHI